ncbi:MAG: MBL fold metallo-hydrolase [Candidatus Diapherotrites archaeon]
MTSDYTLSVHGAGREVGRSSFVLNAHGEKILFDYGVKFTPNETEYPLPIKEKLDAMVLSHAHFDHSGFVPTIFSTNPTNLFMTQPTLELSKILWNDSLKIADQEGETPNFSLAQIQAAEKNTFSMRYNKPVDVTKNARLEFFDAGHILGSSLCKVELKDKIFLYTGDFMASPIRLHDGADLKSVGKVDYLLMESTYGDRSHPDREKTIHAFMSKIRETLDRGGHAIVAAFAIGRTQEILDILFEYGVDAPVFVDGMSRQVTEIYDRYPLFNKKPKVIRRMLEQLNFVRHPGVRKQTLKQPSVIVTTAGMLEGGPVMYYLGKLHDDERSTLLITGYQVEGTKGRMLLETGKIELDHGVVEPKLEIQRFDFSAHSGKDDLIKTVKLFSPEHVLLIHGDVKISGKFTEELRKMGFNVSNPSVGETIRL